MTYSLPTHVNPEVFRTYDIRGPVNSSHIHPELAYAIGLVFGSMAQEAQQTTVITGRDGRLSGESIQSALNQGLIDSGVDVINIGVVASPILYFATHSLSSQSGIMVTASHNPAPDNGFKLVLAGKTLNSDGVQTIYQRIIAKQFTTGQGKLTHNDTVVSDYIKTITTKINLSRPLKVVLDCGNGVGAVAGPEVLTRLGCHVIELYSDIDGRFPNHHPDPTIPANLNDLIAAVAAHQADIGLALDGDADRLGVVTNSGHIIWPDRQLLLFALDMLTRHPGADIIFDVKCSNLLPQLIAEHGGNPIMNRTGHSLIKAKMKACNAPLAGEMSGHLFFNEDWYGFDDGIYVGCRLLQLLAASNGNADDLFDQLPQTCNTPELKLAMPEDQKPTFMAQLARDADFGNATRITIDGLRVDFGDGWGLIRPSNTSPYLTLRFEAQNEVRLNEIQALFRREITKLDATLAVPF